MTLCRSLQCTYHITLSSVAARKEHTGQRQKGLLIHGGYWVCSRNASVPVTLYTLMSTIPQCRLRAEHAQIMHQEYDKQ